MIEIEQAKLAPDFTMTSADGRPIRLGDFRDKKHVVLVSNRGFF